MNWAIILSVLCLTVSVNATFHFPSSFSSSLITGLLKETRLTNCPIDEDTSLPKSTLSPPSRDLIPQFITIGRGTQNYTCASSTNFTTPQSTGATATLFDASCLAAIDTNASTETDAEQSILHTLPDVLKSLPLSSADLLANILHQITGQRPVIGKHYFNSDGKPVFDLRTVQSGKDSRSDSGSGSEGHWMVAEKEDDMAAPGKPGYGVSGDVAWLKLRGVEGGIREVYRVHTAGGEAPTTCLGMPEVFTVDYTAEYWFFA